MTCRYKSPIQSTLKNLFCFRFVCREFVGANAFDTKLYVNATDTNVNAKAAEKGKK